MAITLKSIAAKIYAKVIARQTRQWSKNPVRIQEKVFKKLISEASETVFGRDHNFISINDFSDFSRAVPVRDYEGLRGYIDRIINGELDILWPGKPIYFAKTSGTTSGVKYIPLTKQSLPHHIKAARNAILSYIHETGNADFVNGNMIFLQGSPELQEKNGIKLGRLSGIVAHYVPNYLQKNRLPSLKTNSIEDWETKVEAIVEETKDEEMSIISGIPSWVQMYFEKLVAATGTKIGELFPNFNLFIYGGVNYEPYRSKFENLIGRKVDSIELFPASEGFFAYQDSQKEKGMLLLLNSGIFYEFIETSNFEKETPKRLTIGEVKMEVNYVMIISNDAGLWAYNLGDTVKFTSLKPHRLLVTGRIKHFISAFGEHVIAAEVEKAIKTAMEELDFSISEFTVAPQTNPTPNELPYHEWYIEFEKLPKDIASLEVTLDLSMKQLNSYYEDLILGKVLRPLKITIVKKGGFSEYMKSQGKLGGQNKIPRLSNDRKIADFLSALK